MRKYLPSANFDSVSAAEHRRFPAENRQSRGRSKIFPLGEILAPSRFLHNFVLQRSDRAQHFRTCESIDSVQNREAELHDFEAREAKAKAFALVRGSASCSANF